MYAERGRGELQPALLVAELHRDALIGGRIDAAQPIDEVHMPGRPPELAIGGSLQTHLLLAADDLPDRLVLHLPQLVPADGAVGEILPGLQEPGRPQQAPYVIGPERRRLTHLDHLSPPQPKPTRPDRHPHLPTRAASVDECAG